jgi:hypothetical protein
VLQGNALDVSDNRADRLYRIEPADFLNSKAEPKISVVLSGKGVNPNGIYPARDGSMLMVGFKAAEEARGYSVNKKGDVTELAKPIGRLDGLYQMSDGTILATDWNSGCSSAGRRGTARKSWRRTSRAPPTFAPIATARA